MSASKNLEYEKTSFLNKSNSAFIERMYLKFVNRDADLPESWKDYFEAIGDELNVIVLTKDHNEFMSLYYNGVLVGTETYATVDDSVTGILMSHIGRREDRGGSADLWMELGEILIYDTTLSAAQVTELTSHLTTKWTGGL